MTDNVAPVTGPLSSGGSTNDTDLTVRLSLSGTNAVAGDSIQLYNGTGTGSQLGSSYTLTATDISNGFADVQTGTLSNGTTYTITGRVTDQAGNQSAASGSFVVTESGTAPSAPSIASVTDNVAPVTGPLSSGGSTNDTDLTVRLSLSGTNAVAGDSIQLYNGTGTGSQLGSSYTLTATDISNGFADVQTGTLSNGTTYTITGRVTDQAGNQSAASGSFVVTEDTSAPSAPSITSVTDNVLPITGTIADNGSSNDTTLTIAGTAEAGSTVTIYDTDGTTVVGSGIAIGGSYSITTSALSEGSHTLTAKATDAAGNQGAASTAFHVSIDTSAPSAPSIASVTDNVLPITGTVADNGSSNDTTLTIAGTAEAGSTVTIYDTDGTTVLGSAVATGGNYSITTSALSEGSHTLTAKATDAAGNQGAASAAFHVSIDTSAPSAPSIASVTDNVLPITGTIADNGSSNDTTLTIAGTAEAGSTVTIYDTDGTTVVGSGIAIGGSYSITTSALSEGSHTLTAKATDAAGNQGAASIAFHVGIDSLSPTDITLSNASVAENSAVGTVVGLFSDVDPGATGTASFSLLDDAAGRFAITGGNLVVVGSLDYETAQSHQITVRVTDAAGNIFDKALTIAVTDVAGVTLNGDANANVLVGTPEADTLNGLGGNDRLQGLGGNDWLDGGDGFDRAVYTDATGPVTVNLAAGTASGAGVGSDTLISIEAAVGSDFADTFDATGFTGWSTQPGVALGQSAFEGRGGDDVITGRINDLGQSLTRVEYLSASAAVTVDLAARTGHGTLAGDAAHVGNDTFTNALQGVFGSAYNDTIYGSNNAAFTYEVFEGRGGDDYIDGRGGYDMVAYNNDPTTTSGITVHLAAGTVTGDGSVGTDTLRDVEAVRGTNFDDLFDATGYGVAGALNVSSTNGTFNDFSGAGGNDTITGNGNTRLNYSGAQAAVTVDLQITTGTAVTVAGTATGTTEGTDTFTGVNAVQGSVFADTLLGSNYNNNFTALGGDDYIDGRGGFDTAIYNNLNTVTGGVAVNMAAGTVTGDASTGTDTLRNIEAIQGTGYADSYDATGYGQAGALNVSTSNGSFNQFEGLGGDDSVTGNGNTRVVYSNATGGVTITIGAGGAGSASGDASTGHDTFTGGVNSAIGSSSADSYDASGFNAGFNSFQGNGGNDTITGNGSTQAQYSNATSGVTITIGAGGAGSASGDGSVGSDIFVSGVNSAVGGNLNDTYNASAYGAGLFNSFQGNGGNDTITGNGNTQAQYGNATAGVNVSLSTGTATGDDSVGTDTITGGVNSVLGSSFNDTLTGSSGNDILLGNAGNDTLAGLGGIDTLTGGAGNDNFKFSSGAAAGATITDFSGNGASAGDTLEFHGFGLAADGASFTWLSGNQWQIHSGLDGHNEMIMLSGTTSTSVHSTDYQFLV
ncbi:beta strand repeat-containing protein [Bradyrhizobium sp. SZCCHNG3015]|uniref:beta strand repeat-containing protein n=1 Tax=Bradyrhizobium sp. SZCCHNG3015 TaxID=3057270 RepID=UPI0028E92E33|nr:Ig-like domain-containing protein [Bradyrhizobium sp. SZCCHNG3015]